MFSFRLVPGWLFALAFDASHQFDETWILVHVSPVWIGLKPLVILIAETDSSFQPSQCLDLSPLQKISRREPVRNIVIGFGDLPDFRRELFICLRVLTLRAETDGEDRPYAVDLRMLLQDLLEDLYRFVDLVWNGSGATPTIYNTGTIAKTSGPPAALSAITVQLSAY